jgi:hypothetical protein
MSTEKLLQSLTEFVTKNPEHPNAGQFARALAELHATAEKTEQDKSLRSYLTESVPILVREIVEDAAKQALEREKRYVEREEKKNAKPPELTAEQKTLSLQEALKQQRAWDLSSTLLHQAKGLERLAELGYEPSNTGVTAGALIKPVYDAAQRDEARAQAAKLRERAFEILNEAGFADLS